jgi:TonB-linked SusC/RagA family outer membrane protein
MKIMNLSKLRLRGFRRLVLLWMLCCAFIVNAQINVRGTVKDTNGEPLTGLSVLVKGTSMGTITDISGNFSIQVPNQKNELTFSFIGYKKQTLVVGNNKQVTITMQEDNELLDEVMVVGYGTQKKVSMTGSVSQLGNKELVRSPLPNVSQMLAGKLPGLVTKQESGQPGADDAAMYIRGMGTWGDAKPMILVDGVERSFNNLDPNEIESVSILKDASSAAVYGVKGANGVILVTTKRGTADRKPQISYSGSMTLSQNTNFPKFLDGEEYAKWYNYAESINGRTPLFTASDIDKIKNGDPDGHFGNTNWYDLLFKKTAITQQHNVSVNGGSKNIVYFLSLGYLNQEGTVKNVDYDRYNFRMNVDAKITKDFTVSADISGRVEDRSNPALSDFTGKGNTSGSNLVNMMMAAHPYINAYDKNGIPMASSLSQKNPLAARDLSGTNDKNNTVVNGSIAFKYDPSFIKGLSMKFTSSCDVEYETNQTFFTPVTLSIFNPSTKEVTLNTGLEFGTNAQLTEGTVKTTRSTFQEQINYNHTFAEKHNFGFLFVAEQSKWKEHKMGAYVEGFDFYDLPQLDFGKTNPQKPTGSSQELPRVGLVGRLNYDYAGKYLAEVSARADASTVFAKENRWGYFPAASLGWRISEENFIKDNFSFVDNLKLRVSGGILGNDRIDPFQYLRMMTLTVPAAVIGGVPVNGLFSSNVPNYDITWEKSHNYNIGLDASLWNGLLSMEVDGFYKVTEDILTGVAALHPPSIGGYYPGVVNMGKVDVKGFELVLKHNNKIGQVNYFLKGNISYAKNRILRIDESANIPDYQRVIGTSVGTKFGFIADGLFQTDKEAQTSPTWSKSARAGDIKYRDINGDGKITYEQDQVAIGKSNIPEMNFGFELNADWKGFDFSANFQGAAMCDVSLMGFYPGIGWDDTAYTRTFYGNANTPRYLVQGAWTPENTTGKYPRLDTQYRDNNNCASSLWVKDGSYIRLKTLQIGYSIPLKLLTKMNIARMRVYASGSNLFTLSGLDYLDPEVPDVNNGYYPQQRTFSFGMNLTF